MTVEITTPEIIQKHTEDYRTSENMISRRSESENKRRNILRAHSKSLFDGDIALETINLVTIDRQSISRLLYYYKLYQQIVDIPGVICEFGVQYGATLSNLVNLRGMLEPYNVSRKLFGFDTFEGFVSISDKDHKRNDILKVGDYSVPINYEKQLNDILELQEINCPVSHIKKFELVKGDVSITVPKWLEDNPEALISMAIFDMDLYRPTKDVLERIIPRLYKGSLLVFDELTLATNPGESVALQEVLAVNNLTLKRDPHQSYCAWTIWGK